MTVPGPSIGSGPVAVDQTYYIAALEEDLARETRARRVLTAVNAQHRATIAAYVERYGDITATDDDNGPDQTRTQGVTDA